RALIGEAFVFRYPFQQVAGPTHFIIRSWVMPEDLQSQLEPPGFFDVLCKQIGQDGLADPDKEVLQVSFQVKRWLLPVLSDASTFRFQPLSAVQSASTGDARTAVHNKSGVDCWRDVVVHQVVHDTIAEISSPYL